MARNAAAKDRQGGGKGQSRSSKREVGQYGNSRPREDKSVRRARGRATDGRYLAAKEATDAAIRKLERLEAELAARPPEQVVDDHVVVSIHVNREAAEMQRGHEGWEMWQARELIAQGYSIDHVIAYTGWGRHWLADLVGNDGYLK